MNEIFGEKLISKITKLNLVFVVGQFLLVFLKDGWLPQFVPLFYSRPWGEEQLAAKAFLWAVPALSLVIFLLHLWLIKVFTKKESKLLAVLNSSFALLFTILASVTLAKIVFLVS